MNLKKRKKQRYKIEAKNAELKQSHGFGRYQFSGSFGMKVQSYLMAFIVISKPIVSKRRQTKATGFKNKTNNGYI